MARIRTIKPEYWTDERVGECSVSARLLFIACWNFSDDHGGLDRSSKQLKAQAFPYDNIDCEPLVQELLKVGLLIEYEVSGKKYLHIKGFRTHQKVEKPAKPRIPVYSSSPNPPRILPESSAQSNGHSPESSGLFSGRECKGMEGSVCETPPTSPRARTHLTDGEAVDSQEYEQAIMAKYPRGPNPPNWAPALHHAHQLVSNGLATWPDLVQSVERYATYVASGSVSVNVAAHNFFDPRKGNQWQQSWEIVPKTNGKPAYVSPKSTEQLENEAIAKGISEGRSDIDIAASIDVPIDRVRQAREATHAEH